MWASLSQQSDLSILINYKVFGSSIIDALLLSAGFNNFNLNNHIFKNLILP